MSSIVKKLKKVFKKVVKTVKKVLPYAIFAAAVVFTAGAALATFGTPALTGIFSWAPRLAALAGQGGVLSGTVGTIVVNAVEQAIIGTAIGGVTALATGGDIKSGMVIGGLGGLVTGGITGALNLKGPAGAEMARGRQTLGAGVGTEVTAAAADTAAAAPLAAPAAAQEAYILGDSGGRATLRPGALWAFDKTVNRIVLQGQPSTMTSEMLAPFARRGLTPGEIGLGQGGAQTAATLPVVPPVVEPKIPWKDKTALQRLAFLTAEGWEKFSPAIAGGVAAVLGRDETDYAKAEEIRQAGLEREELRRSERFATSGRGLLA